MIATRYESANLIIIGKIQVMVRVRVGVSLNGDIHTPYKKVGMSPIITGNIHPDVQKYKQVGPSPHSNVIAIFRLLELLDQLKGIHSFLSL